MYVKQSVTICTIYFEQIRSGVGQVLQQKPLQWASDEPRCHSEIVESNPCLASVGPSEQLILLLYHQIPSGNLTKLWKDPPLFMGKSTISMAVFNSYFDITRG